MKRRISDGVYNLIFSVSSLALMWLIWLIAYFAEGNDYVLPSFSQTVKSMFALMGTGAFWSALFATLGRTAIGFLVSFACAAVFSSLCEAFKPFKKIFSPMVSVLRALPTMAIILILLLWTSPRVAPIIVSFMVTFPLCFSQFCAAFGGIDSGLLEMAQIYRFTRRQKILKIYLPLVAPAVLAQAGAAFSLTLKVMVSAEVMANTYVSIGGMMQQQVSGFIDMPALFALTLVTVIMGALFERLFKLFNLFTNRWRGQPLKSGFIVRAINGIFRRKNSRTKGASDD